MTLCSCHGLCLHQALSYPKKYPPKNGLMDIFMWYVSHTGIFVVFGMLAKGEVNLPQACAHSSGLSGTVVANIFYQTSKIMSVLYAVETCEIWGCSTIDWWLQHFFLQLWNTGQSTTCSKQSASSPNHILLTFNPLICYHASNNPHHYHRAKDYGNFCHLCLCCNWADMLFEHMYYGIQTHTIKIKDPGHLLNNYTNQHVGKCFDMWLKLFFFPCKTVEIATNLKSRWTLISFYTWAKKREQVNKLKSCLSRFCGMKSNNRK